MYLYYIYVLGISFRISDRKIDYVRFRVDLGLINKTCDM